MKIRLAEIEWVYVNLAIRPKRDEYVRRECSRVGITAKRFNALTWQDYDGPELDIARMLEFSEPGRIGCYLSHMTIIDGARGTQGILGVLEDDVLFCDDFSERMQYIETNFDKPWDMFFLGSTYHINPAVWHADTLGRDFEQTEIRYIHRIYGTWNTYAYLVNRSSADKIADLMRANVHRCTAVDHLFILIEPELECYCFTPGMAFQQNGVSDIVCEYTKFSNFMRLGPYVFTRRLEDFNYDRFDFAEGAKHDA